MTTAPEEDGTERKPRRYDREMKMKTGEKGAVRVTRTVPHDDEHDPQIPKIALAFAAALVVSAVTLAGVASYTGFGATHVPPSTVVASRSLIFLDAADGAIEVREGRDNSFVTMLPRKRNNFIRTVVRGLAFHRKKQGLGPQHPFMLTRWADGRLSLKDTTNGRSIQLRAFGYPNEKAFARLLEVGVANVGGEQS
ncbi:MAG: photosynthetic complex assembly protein PuhC [Pseudomonadota bacterium]